MVVILQNITALWIATKIFPKLQETDYTYSKRKKLNKRYFLNKY